MTPIIISLIVIISFVIFTITIRRILEKFYDRAELPDDINVNIRGMLVELEDKGFFITLYNESDQGKFGIRINSDNKYKYSEISEYVLFLKDYMSYYNYNNVFANYNVIVEIYDFPTINSVRIGSKIENINNESIIDYFSIDFRIDTNWFERFITAKSDDTGPR